LTSYFGPGTVTPVTVHWTLISYRTHEGRLDKLIGLVLIVAVLVAFDLAAVLWGADSRPSVDELPSHHV
jgi:hypothetical protein